jgi:NAD-dependent deacetylase
MATTLGREHIVVLTGAGVSAESGIPTYRDAADGLWYRHDPMEVASIEAWRRDPQRVLDFHNARREELRTVQPNDAHRAIAALEQAYDVTVITQNVDDLHERAGSTHVLHLHGVFTRMHEDGDPLVTYPYDAPLHLGDLGPGGRQLRPAVVWFGEEVPLFDVARRTVGQANIVIVAGTSLSVYPAAGLVLDAHGARRKYFVNQEPSLDELSMGHAGHFDDWICLIGRASTGLRQVSDWLLAARRPT